MRGTWQTTDGGGGGGGGLVLIAVVVLAGSGAASAAASAVASLLVTIAVVLGSLIGLAVLGGIGWLAWRARQDRPGAPVTARAVSPVPPAARPQLEEPHNQAIGPGRSVHLHFHGLTPDQIAALVTRSDAYLEEDQ